jgi:hypothetical protein
MTARPLLFAAAAAIAISAAACGSDTHEASAPSATLGPAVSAPSSATAPPITDSALLGAALLQPRDLPSGYAPLDLSYDNPAAPETTAPDRSRTDPAECAAVLRPISEQAPGALAGAASNYSGPDFADIDIDAASYTDPASAFESLQRTLAGCVAFNGTDADGVALDYRISDLDLPSVGNASRAVRVSTTSDGFTVVSDVVIGVAGSSVFQLVATGQTPMDPAVLGGLARTQAQRLMGTLGP